MSVRERRIHVRQNDLRQRRSVAGGVVKRPTAHAGDAGGDLHPGEGEEVPEPGSVGIKVVVHVPGPLDVQGPILHPVGHVLAADTAVVVADGTVVQGPGGGVK